MKNMKRFDSKILINVSQEVKEKLEALAEEQDMTVSQVVRRMINSHFKMYEKQKTQSVSD